MDSATRRVAVAAALTGAALFTAAPQAAAGDGPAAPPALTAATLAAAHDAATEPAILDTLSRFFARESAAGRTRAAPRTGQAAPRIVGEAVPVRTLSAAFVAGKPGAAPSTLEHLASTAVAADGRTASLWTVPAAGGGSAWQVVNIATGDDEARYTAAGARGLPGGTVFREPQIDAWYVHDASRVLPLDAEARAAVGTRGVTLRAYRARVAEAYGDKLPGSPYARSGAAGGYGPGAARGPVAGPPPPAAGAAPARPAPALAAPDAPGGGPTAVSAVAGAGALLALALGGAAAARRRSRTPQGAVQGR
ncbi:hypothetical protein EES43_05720 [Streptomyces sp. ADI96-02]|uniref:hypothetical protein n=1 Tax=Streptomyces sp. ADI96-02 TaxID=1522760 RepID=UPI000F559A64|nr:hypothetical protein [Streptomyces sp. ADI96-02]RPK66435.1 hypothetical protein EES43_05720 [Streptomyces sp. ADI96-02]